MSSLGRHECSQYTVVGLRSHSAPRCPLDGVRRHSTALLADERCSLEEGAGRRLTT